MEKGTDEALGCDIRRESQIALSHIRRDCPGRTTVPSLETSIHYLSWKFILASVGLPYHFLHVICQKGHVSAEEDVNDGSATGKQHPIAL